MKIPVIALAIALSLGAVAAFIAARWTSVEQTSGSRVVIVEQPIGAGTTIRADQIKTINWTGSTFPQDASTSTAIVVGRIANVSMIPGELVLSGKLAPINATGGLSSTIQPGKRAITVKVNEVVAVAGFALPGSYVDVLVTGKDAVGQYFTRTVLSRLKVLAVAQQTTVEADKPKVVDDVTLELTTLESEKLDLARTIGVLSLALRNEFDTTVTNSSGVRLHDIVYAPSTGPTTSSPAAQTVAAPLRKNLGSEEIRGTSRQSIATP